MKSDNPQAREIEEARQAYVESEELKQARTKCQQTWRDLVKAYEAGEIPAEAMYDGPSGPEMRYVMPTEAGMLDHAEMEAKYADMQRWLRSQIRFQEGNLYFEVDMANPESLEDHKRGYAMYTRSFALASILDKSLRREVEGLEDLEDWKRWLAEVLRPEFYGKTWTEIEANPPECVTSLKLADMFVFVTRDDAWYTEQCAFRVWVGTPYAPDSWML